MIAYTEEDQEKEWPSEDDTKWLLEGSDDGSVWDGNDDDGNAWKGLDDESALKVYNRQGQQGRRHYIAHS